MEIKSRIMSWATAANTVRFQILMATVMMMMLLLMMMTMMTASWDH
jgi:hypothetical protein